MAREQPPFRNTFTTARNAGAEARKSLAQEAAERDLAKTILNPMEVYGEYDFGRMLFTTLGGQARPLTMDDLKQFRYQSQQLGKKFKGGIRTKQVIDASLPADRERANKQITMAIPVMNRAGTVHFQTNAGPDSDKTRHHVYVQFLNYDATVASPKPADRIVGEMLKGYVKIECDCGRWRYWYRYIATIGRFNQGRPETGFPKIRNPNLHGVACKHILRVMQTVIGSPTFKGYAMRMIETGRASVQAKKKDTTVREMAKLVEQFENEKGRQRKVLTTEEKQKARGYVPAAKRPPAQIRADAKLKQKAATKAKQKAARAAKTAKTSVENNLKKMLQLGGINQAQYDEMMKVLRNK
jgi:hypothetical protein